MHTYTECSGQDKRFHFDQAFEHRPLYLKLISNGNHRRQLLRARFCKISCIVCAYADIKIFPETVFRGKTCGQAKFMVEAIVGMFFKPVSMIKISYMKQFTSVEPVFYA